MSLHDVIIVCPRPKKTHMSRVFENMMLGKRFEPKADQKQENGGKSIMKNFIIFIRCHLFLGVIT